MSARAKAQAKHRYYCACGAVVFGNGGRASHFGADNDAHRARREARENAGHKEILRSTWERLSEPFREYRGVERSPMVDGFARGVRLAELYQLCTEAERALIDRGSK